MVPEVRGHEGAQGDREQHAGERDATPQGRASPRLMRWGPGSPCLVPQTATTDAIRARPKKRATSAGRDRFRIGDGSPPAWCHAVERSLRAAEVARCGSIANTERLHGHPSRCLRSGFQSRRPCKEFTCIGADDRFRQAHSGSFQPTIARRADSMTSDGDGGKWHFQLSCSAAGAAWAGDQASGGVGAHVPDFTLAAPKAAEDQNLVVGAEDFQTNEHQGGCRHHRNLQHVLTSLPEAGAVCERGLPKDRRRPRTQGPGQEIGIGVGNSAFEAGYFKYTSRSPSRCSRTPISKSTSFSARSGPRTSSVRGWRR